MWSRSKILAELPLREKLVISGLLPSILVLLLGTAAFVTYDLVSFRASMLRDLRGHAHFIALTTRASIQFRTFDYAARILAGLESNGEITTAAIYDENGEIVVEFVKDRQQPTQFPALTSRGYPESPGDRIWLFQPIFLEDQTIGTVFIEASFTRFWHRLKILLAGAAVALLLLLLLAFLLSSRLQRHITSPLFALAATARAVSVNKDYSVRADQHRGPEFHLLTSAFNQMLGQIQSQDAELRSRTAQLEAANTELESFTYTVAHDLRAPLRSLSGFSHLLIQKHAESLSDEARGFLHRIRANAERMAALIDDLLAFSHLDREPVRIHEVEPGSAAREAIEELQPMFKGRQIDLQVDPLPPAQADGALLRQVYVNLLSNALKYSRPREVAKIQIGSQTQQGRPVYFVRDNGVGFDMRYAAKLFRVFQRLHSADDFEGTGVGLAIVQRIVGRLGGRIWAEAEPDKGAAFYFTLSEEKT